MKLAFVQAPAWGRDCPPYTMCLLAALARREGHSVSLFDLNNTLYHTSSAFKKMWDDKDYYTFWESRESVCAFLEAGKRTVDFYVDKILKTDAEIIGFTVHFSSVWSSLEIARRIKERDAGRLIVFGGPDCSRNQKGDYLIKQDCVDIVVHGEGEYPLFEIINNFANLKEIKSIKGCLLLKDGLIVDGGNAKIVDNLDTLPIPDYSDFRDDIELRMYREPHRLDIFDSRGCIMGCHFCSEWQFWRKFRSKSGKRIYEEVIQHMQDFPQVNYFYFIGSLVNGDMQALEIFCDLVISNNLKIQWAGQAIIRQEMTKGLLGKMRRAGCSWIGYGVESGSQMVLDRMNKRFSLAVANRVLSDTKEAGIATQANFMFGLPTETADDFNQTLDFLKANRKYMDTILASQSFCVIDKGTYLYSHPEEFGIKNRAHHLYWESDNGRNNYPERMRRYEEFCKLALSLGVPETSGVLRCRPDKWLLLADYFLFKREYPLAIENYVKAERFETRNRSLLNKLSLCYEKTGAYEAAREALSQSLEVKDTLKDNAFSDRAIEQRVSFLDKLIGGKLCQDLDYRSLESPELAKVLRHYTGTNYKGVDLKRIFTSFDFNEKQRSMCHALYSHGLWPKLSNYILADVQKARRETFLFGYPYWLVIDPCNHCDLRCPFCPTGQNRKTRVRRKLGLEDFKSIIDKLGPYLIHLDLVNWGEPLLNENIFEMIRYAKRYRADIKVDSNLNHLRAEDAENLILSGLDKIVVSIDGLTKETYGKYRVGGNFELAMNNLELLVKKRKDLNRTKPYITWQFLVFRHNEHEIEGALKLGKKIGVDHVGITKAFIGEKDWMPLNPQYSNYNAEQIKDDGLTFDHFKADSLLRCNWPWEAVVINTNNSISPCCSVEDQKDDFYNIFDEPFEDIWNRDKYLEARSYIRDRKQKAAVDNNICIGCRHLGMINIDILSCHSFFDSL